MLKTIDSVRGAMGIVACALALICILGAGVMADIPSQDLGSGALDRGEATGFAAKAHVVLKRHCVRCHQSGFDAGGAKQGFGNSSSVAAQDGPLDSLDLLSIANDPGLIRRGVPDGSPLYNAMVSRRMPPHGVVGAGGKVREQSKVSWRELADVRDWISSLEPENGRCGSTMRVSARAIGDDIATFVAALSVGRARRTRFISLAHLANACVSRADIKSYRARLGNVLNGLSWRSGVAQLELVGGAGLVMAFNLDDLDWPQERWDWLSARARSSKGLAAVLSSKTVESLGSEFPVVRADWFANEVASPMVYSALLGLPVSVRGLRAKLQGIYGPPGKIGVGGVERSAETSSARLIARHSFGANGYLLETIDEVEGGGKSRFLRDVHAVFEAVYGDSQELRDTRGYADISARRFLFPLPNGFIGVMVTDRDGYRFGSRAGQVRPVVELEKTTRGSVSESRKMDRRQAGGSMRCFACHGRAALPFTDELTGRLETSKQGGGRARLQLETWREVSSNEVSVGDLGARDLARRYRGFVDLKRGAAEVWLDEAEFLARIDRYEGALIGVARQLRQGVVSRIDFNSLVGELFGERAGKEKEPVAGIRGAGDPATGVFDVHWRLSLWSDKAQYKTGDTATIFAQSSQDCRLTLVGVDVQGIGTVLFPNGFTKDNLIVSGQVLSIPGVDGAFRLKFEEAGIETIVGMCALASVDQLAGVEHAFDTQKFSVLGNWRGHVSNAFIEESEWYQRVRTANGKKKRRKSRRRRRRSREPSWLLEDGSPYIGARQALTISIEP